MTGHHDQSSSQEERLLRVLAEQLKIPLLQIAQAAELGQSERLRDIGITAERALHLVDSFVLAAEVDQQQLQLEPITLSSVLYDAAQTLQPLADQYDCDLELHLEGKYRPIMADRHTLHAGLVMLGQSFIEAGSTTRPKVVLAAYKSRNRITAGLFAENELPADRFRRALQLYGHARQAMPSLQAAAGAGLFVADALFGAMSAPLQTARHHNLNGLAATFLPSAQLALV